MNTLARPDSNRAAANMLREMADLLEQQNASPYRVNAYRRAAGTIDSSQLDIAEIAKRGAEALIEIPNIGPSIAASLIEIAATGRLSRLDRLRGTLDPAQVFATIPGIGPQLATILHDSLHIDTLEELELAAHDGRLEQVPGFGPSRISAIRAVLASRLSRRPRRHQRTSGTPGIPVLLDADSEYRQRAREGSLHRIAPRRFNPGHRAWLPIMHIDRDGWHLSLLFSNTARAHQLGKTGDWVVVYFDDDDHHEGQCTVVTETSGSLKGQRVVRGREREQMLAS
jgi:putative hydrolase